MYISMIYRSASGDISSAEWTSKTEAIKHLEEGAGSKEVIYFFEVSAKPNERFYTYEDEMYNMDDDWKNRGEQLTHRDCLELIQEWIEDKSRRATRNSPNPNNAILRSVATILNLEECDVLLGSELKNLVEKVVYGKEVSRKDFARYKKALQAFLAREN